MPGTRLATGRRLAWRDTPPKIHAWVQQELPDSELVREHPNGMSPGCAVSLATPTDQVFVKAVSTALNEDTVNLFRNELATLAGLPAAAYRPRLRASFDDGDWVAIMLDHVDGRHPDLTRSTDAAAVAAVLAAQAAELTPPPAGVEAPSVFERLRRWLDRWADVAEAPERYLPAWAVADFDRLHARALALPDRLTTECLAHFDVRADNLLIRPDGRAVVLDWGRPHRAPQWTDLALLAGQVPAEDAPAALIDWIPAADRAAAVDLLLVFAGQEAWWGQQPAPRSLPTLPGFCRDDAHHLFRTLRRLEGADSTG